METRDSLYKDPLSFELSPKEFKLFYFPCGSMSSFHESLDITEDSKEIDWNFAQKQGDPEERNSLIMENLNYIAYEQISLEKTGMQSFENLAEFTMGNLAGATHNKLYKDAETNTELTQNEIKELQSQVEQNFFMLGDLSAQLKAKQKDCYESDKNLKLAKSELASARDRLKGFEVEFLKLKLIVEDIADEEGTNRTSRQSSGESSFELIKSKLEIIKQKLHKGQKFKYSPPQIGSYENASKRASIVSPIEGRIQNLSRYRCKEPDDELHTERPKSTCGFDYDGTEQITYKEVLKDLREITTRASKALKNSNLSRRTQLTSGFFTKREDPDRLKQEKRLDRFKPCKNY